MHKGIIILIEAEDKEEALEKVDEFLQPYGEGDVWDWYQVGGRWQNTLAPKHDEFKTWSRQFLGEKQKALQPAGEEASEFLFQSTIDGHQQELQQKWEELGMEGKHPWSNHYDLPNGGNSYDVMPLSECLGIVKEWRQDLMAAADGYFQKLLEEREKEALNKEAWPHSAYYAGLYRDAKYGTFCFDTNVFNATTHTAEEIPENIDGYWAVMIDIHN